jgi:CubicO group peptidase (beta-lactamase class C family)
MPARPKPVVLESRPLDTRAVEQLVSDARQSDSAALVLIKDEKLVGDWRFTKRRGPLPAMSITKCILSLAVGSLIDRGKLRFDQPVHELYPAWNTGRKRDVTIFHLLTHTSGLDEGKGTHEIYRQRSFVKFTLDSDILFEPGTRYQYSNRGANLVSGIVGKASGMRTDRYVDEVLFEPLGIREYFWSRDRAGQPQGLAGLHFLARDLAKIGELLLREGAYEGRQLISREWIRRSLSLGSTTQPTNRRKGLAWTLIPDYTHITVDEAIVAGWRAAGAEDAFIAKTEPLVGRRFDSVPSFVQALRDLFGDPKLSEWNENTWQRDVPDARFEFGPIVGASAKGTLGQYLVVLPRDRLVAVRMRREPKNLALRNDPERVFPDFVERVRGLVESAREGRNP